MSDILEHKGYFGSAEFSAEDNVFHGKLLYIRSLVTYEADNVEGLKNAFHEAVEDYLEMCQANELKPETPFRGSFNVRVGRNLHRKLALEAAQRQSEQFDCSGAGAGSGTRLVSFFMSAPMFFCEDELRS